MEIEVSDGSNTGTIRQIQTAGKLNGALVYGRFIESIADYSQWQTIYFLLLRVGGAFPSALIITVANPILKS